MISIFGNLHKSKPSLNHPKFAFTLAEVLITLGIIGVVAALTLPTVIQNYQKNMTLTRLKKLYSVVYNAMERAKSDYGTDVNLWDIPNSTDAVMKSDYFAEKYILPYLQDFKDCSKTPKRNCSISYKTGSNSSLNTVKNENRTIILKGGEIISIYAGKGNKNEAEDHTRVQIYLFPNGYRENMILGKDVFLVELGGGQGESGLDRNRIMPYGWSISASSCNSYTTRCKDSDRATCLALIMCEGWKIPDYYPW
ncbi:type II secretion system protein [bacterium]|nr:type II secretion system protein [bacterium]